MVIIPITKMYVVRLTSHFLSFQSIRLSDCSSLGVPRVTNFLEINGREKLGETYIKAVASNHLANSTLFFFFRYKEV